VPAIEMGDIVLRMEQTADGNNFGEIWKHVKALIPAGSGGGEREPANKPSEPEGEAPAGKALKVQRVSVGQITTQFAANVAGIDKEWSFSIPAFEMNMHENANAESETTVPKLTARIVDRILGEAVKLAEAELPPEVATLLTSKADNIGDLLKQEADSVIEEKKGELKNELDGLLKKKNF